MHELRPVTGRSFFDTIQSHEILAKQPQMSKQQVNLLFGKASEMRFCEWGSGWILQKGGGFYEVYTEEF